MSDTSSAPEFQQPENDDLDHEFRVVLVLERKDENENEMDEFNLENISTFSKMNEFFDQFDEEVALPNEGNIKYDVGSDGLVVIVVNGKELKETVVKFIDEYKVTK